MVVNEDNNESEFRTATVYCQLITPSDPQFDSVSEQMFGSVPSKRQDIIIPVFDITFDNINPTPYLNEMIQDEIDDYIRENQIIVQKVREADTDSIIKNTPHMKPRSEHVPVGDIAITPSGDGIIADFDFDKIIEICENKNS